MTRNKKILLGVLLVVVIGAIGYANFVFKRTSGTSVTVEKIARRDLEAVVSASGTIQPVRQVNVGAPAAGTVVDLQVHEGDVVKKGQFLMQIDPRNLQIQVDSQNASLAAAKSQLEESRKAVESARVGLAQSQAEFNRQKGLMKNGLTSRQTYEAAENDLKMKQSAVDQGEQSLKTQDTRIKQQEALLQNAQYDLSKVRITSPIDGVVIKRDVDIGEMVSGNAFQTMALLTVADMSVVRAEIQVDETDIPFVSIGQRAKVTIDALPDQTFAGTVTEVGNSPVQASGSSSTALATDFKVVVTLDHEIKDVRPGFTCTAAITTATRQQAVSVPIQSLAERELVVDAQGKVVPTPAPPPGARRTVAPAAADLPPGQSRKAIEGVFVVTDGHAVFTPVKTGIAGDKYFEVLSGLSVGDQVITGPFASVRSLKDGDPVTITTTPVVTPSTSSTQ
jgi:HlyD family secretion protein